jgi:hypothetical protein
MKYVHPNSYGNVNGMYSNTARVFTGEVLRTQRFKKKARQSPRMTETPRVRALEYLENKKQKIPVRSIMKQMLSACNTTKPLVGFGYNAPISCEPRQSLSNGLMVPRSVYLKHRNIRHNSGPVVRLFHFSITKLPKQASVGDTIKLCSNDSNAVIYTHTFPLWLWKPGSTKTIFEIEIPTRLFIEGVTSHKLTLTSFYPILPAKNLTKNMKDNHSIYTTVIMSQFLATIKKIEQQPMPCTIGDYGPNPHGGRKRNHTLEIPGIGSMKKSSSDSFLTSPICSVMYVTVRLQSFR